MHSNKCLVLVIVEMINEEKPRIFYEGGLVI